MSAPLPELSQNMPELGEIAWNGFDPAGRETRYTIGPAAQREILDRPLELNHERYAEEVAQGPHDKRKGGTAKRRGTPDLDGLFQN